MRCNQISLEYLETLYNDLTSYINNNIYKNINKPYQLYGVDGCKINTNIKLSDYDYIPNNNGTSCCILTMGVYNITNNNLLNLIPVKHKDERKSFIDHTWNIDNTKMNTF